MGLKCGIVGLPNVGKSTLFNALANNKAEAANYPFCTIEPNIGVITVPDPRLDKLNELVKPQKLVPTTIEFLDIAGLVKGASKGEGLGNQFLANIRETDAIVHVIRCFTDDNIVHVDGKIDPVADKQIIDTELQLKDLETIEKRILRVEKIAKSGDKHAKGEMDVLTQYKEHLSKGLNARDAEIDKGTVRDLYLLTEKPVIYVANIDEASVREGNSHVEALKKSVADEKAEVVSLCASVESQIAEFEGGEDKELFLEEYGLKEPGLGRLIRASYHLLDLITYFTAGEKEVKAWTIKKGWKAPKAAGVIHSDFERGFIKAEVIKYDDYLKYGSELACRDAGKLSIEGKEYIVGDGDIVHFRFNV